MRKRLALPMLSGCVLVLAGCTTQPPPPNQHKSADGKAQLQVTSNSFTDGQPIPRQHTCDGLNLSPALEWSGTPPAAKTIAIISDDPDAPGGTWVHWVLYNLPGDRIGLIENVAPGEKLPGGGLHGKNDFGKLGYGGPCPPSGTHKYFFKVYALDTELALKAGATRAELLKAMEGHVLAQGQLMGTYSRLP